MLVVFILASYNSDFLNNNFFNISDSFGIINKPNISFNLNKRNVNIKGKLIRKPLVFLYGGCSLTVEFSVVVRKTRVRLPSSALNLLEKGFQNINFEAKVTLSDDLVHLS